ncbi:hypothetical protein SAQ01S_12980 [Sphingomonas aquatilis NBRC 16722]|nr:hypothetical protein SAQ01S_12980 [Sphingomonas aquatilis NBRC 16722]
MRCKQRDRRPKILRRHAGTLNTRPVGHKTPAPNTPSCRTRSGIHCAWADVASRNDNHQHNGRHKRPTPDPSRTQTTVIPAKAGIQTGKPHGACRNGSGSGFPPPQE